MRTLTIDFHNWNYDERNILVYQKTRDEQWIFVNTIWRKFTVPHNSLTHLTWDERYCFCVGSRQGQRIRTTGSKDARPGDKVTASYDMYSRQMTMGYVEATGRSDDYMLGVDSSIPMSQFDGTVGLGIDNSICFAVDHLRPAMNYLLTAQSDYYILQSSKFDAGDILNEEIERLAQKLVFPASGRLDVALHNEATWIIKPV